MPCVGHTACVLLCYTQNTSLLCYTVCDLCYTALEHSNTRSRTQDWPCVTQVRPLEACVVSVCCVFY